MGVKKYTNSGDWNESLQIFLYSELIKNKKAVEQVKIEDYDKFELTEELIKEYNNWIDDIFKFPEWFKRNKENVERFQQNFGKNFKQKVELWSDRKKNPYFKDKLQAGFEYENHLRNHFKEKYGIRLGQFQKPDEQYNVGENKRGIEIKHDMMYKKTGNLYFEYAEKCDGANKEYVPSGILKDDNSLYFLIGDYNKFWIFRKERLQGIYREERKQYKQDRNYKSKRKIRFITKPTSLGFIYPIPEAEKEALPIETIVKEIIKK